MVSRKHSSLDTNKCLDAEPPEGWMWKSDWYIAPEVLDIDPEASVDTIVEEVGTATSVGR